METKESINGMNGDSLDKAGFFKVIFGEALNRNKSYIELRDIELLDKETMKKEGRKGKVLCTYYNSIGNAAAYKPQFNLYFGVCPRAIDRGKEEDVEVIPVLWADVDTEESFKALGTFEYPPSLMVNSGHGIHAYWLLKEPETVNERTKGILKGLAKHLGADTCFDLSRVLRVPGTKNLKPNVPPTDVKVISFKPEVKYAVKDFDKFFMPVVDAGKSKIVFTETIKDVNVDELKISLATKELILTGKQDGDQYKSRSEADYKVICDMVVAGYDDDTIRAVFEKYPIGEKYHEDGLPYLACSISNARQAAAKENTSSSAKLLLEPSTSKFNEILSATQQSAEKKSRGIPTNFPELDKFTKGLRGIGVLGGPPKIGKSTYALNIAGNAAESGHPVIYCDFENGTEKLCLKILSRLSKFTCAEILTNIDGLRNRPGYEDIKERCLNIGKNLFIHRPSLKDVKQDNGTPLEASNILLWKYVTYIKEELKIDKDILIIVDSLQKLPLWNMSDRRGNIDSWLRAFENARDSFGVTFLIISELARGTYDDASIDSFKESGDIEYTADLAIQMKKGKGANLDYAIELHAVANRNGDTGIISTYRPLYAISTFEESTEGIIRG